METGDYLSKYNNQLTILPDDIGELNAACGWKSCNIERNEKDCENTEDFKPKLRNRSCVSLRDSFQNLRQASLSFLYGSPPPSQASHENTDASKENLNLD